MSISDAVHSIEPWKVLVPVALLTIAYLLEQYACPQFRKSEGELQDDAFDEQAKKNLVVRLAKENLKRGQEQLTKRKDNSP